MPIFTQVTWWCSTGLLAVLLAFAFRGRFWGEYPVFCSYVSGLLGVQLLLFYVFTFHPNAYLSFYWYTRFLLVAGGYGVLWQMYAQTLNPYAGTAKVARVVVNTVFVAIWIHLFFKTMVGQTGELVGRVVLIERNLHSVQALLMTILLSLIWYYRIPIGRNLKGLLLGYGLFVATSLIMLTLRSALGTSFQVWWQILHQISSFVSLGIWTVAFRSYQPNPVPEHEVELERDYELVAQRTLQALSRARGYLARALLQ